VHGWASLTRTELEVVGHVAAGLTNKAIGDIMFISRFTVDSHVRHAYRKLGIGSRVALTRIALNRS
jgi:DNA-binding CsgD family transcriptional regulator